MLHPGKHGDTAGTTMAGAIEAAFLDQWHLFNPDLPLPSEEQLTPLRLFFVAVAQGSVTDTTHSHSGGAHIHGDGSHSHSDGSHSHPVSISQIASQQTTA
jgi:hypothetical protein